MSGTASRNQLHYRFREDVLGVDVAPTWRAAEDTAPAGIYIGRLFRLRVLIWNSGTANAGNQLYSIQYRVNGGSWTTITTSSTHVRSADAGNNADNASLTVQRLTSPASGSFLNGYYDESGATPNINITTGNFTEVEFGLEATSSLSVGDLVEFQTLAGGSALQTYTVTPQFTVGNAGALSKTLGTLTLSGAGELGAGPISGALSKTLDASTLSSVGTVALAASVSKTLGALTSSAAGAVALTGSTSATLGVLTLSGAGDLAIVGTTNVTLGTLTLSAGGTLAGSAITGTLTATLGALAVSAAGDVLIAGTSSPTLGALTVSVSGTVALAGTLTRTLDAATLSSAGVISITGSVSATLGSLTLSATGDVAVVGTLTRTLGALTLDGVGFGNLPTAAGSLSATLAGVSLQSSAEFDDYGRFVRQRRKKRSSGKPPVVPVPQKVVKPEKPRLQAKPSLQVKPRAKQVSRPSAASLKDTIVEGGLAAVDRAEGNDAEMLLLLLTD